MGGAGRIAVGLMLAVLGAHVGAGVAAADVAVGEAQAVVKGQLKDILGPDRLVRDYATFETERGEGALLVLFVADAKEPGDVPLPDQPSCAEMVTGVPLVGVYHVALVVRGVLVNEVRVPAAADDAAREPGALALPWKNRAAYNAAYWGQPVLGDPQAEESPRLVRLADYDGDGNAWEFRLVRPHGCGHLETLLAGYSMRQRKVVLFPVIEKAGTSLWAIDLFPGVDAAGSSRLVRRRDCDPGTDARERTKFRFDARREAWVAIGSRTTPCAGARRVAR